MAPVNGNSSASAIRFKWAAVSLLGTTLLLGTSRELSSSIIDPDVERAVPPTSLAIFTQSLYRVYQ